MNRKALLVPFALSLSLIAPAHAAIQFAPAVNTSTGSIGGPGPAAESMVATDLNGDGKADLVAADWFGTGVRSFLGDGQGHFGPAIVTTLNTSTGSVSAADFDGDGLPDLAVGTGANLIILHGLGDGSFTELERFPLYPAGQIQAYAFDVNGDGKPDVVAPSPGGIQVYLGLGDGRVVKGPFTTLLGIFSALSAANFNNYGIPDIAIVEDFGQRVVTMLGNGDGSFRSGASVTIGFIPEDVIAGDLNGDGIDDVASADSFSFSASVALATSATSFAPTKRQFGVLGPVSVRLSDFDGDGDLDIAVTTVIDSQLYVLTNNGAGGFAAPLTFALTDFNGDGKPDVAAAGPGTLSVLINTSP